MRYSEAATAKYARAYRWWQVKQAAYACVIVGVIAAGVGGLLWGFLHSKAEQARDVQGTAPRYATATVSRTGLVRRPAHDAVTFTGIEGRAVTFEGADENAAFFPGRKARVRYRIGRSGKVYIEDAEPLP